MQPRATVEIEYPTGNLNFRTSMFVTGRIRSFFITRDSIHDFEYLFKKYAYARGVYILLDKFNPTKVYVGKTDYIMDRLNSHKNKDKEAWWNIEIAFVADNADHPLSADATSYLEHEMYVKATKAGTDLKYNGEEPRISGMQPNMINAYKNYFNELSGLSISYGYPIFNNISNNTHHASSSDNSKNKSKIFRLNNKRSSYAIGKYDPSTNNMIILKGSKITAEPAKSYFKYSKQLNELINNGSVVNNKFMKDTLFKSPSTAGSVIIKGSLNGKIQWISNGKSIKDLYGKPKK